ncbi:MAG: hypothetical protein NT118_09685 [Lentisphaerae bacterium]|nr:hypothetical protein [Lentisphaerota bacterium]
MTKVIVIVTDLEYRKASHIFKNADGFDCISAPSDEAGLAEKIREAGAKFAIVGVNRYCGGLYDAIPAGGVIVRFGVGHDGLDKTLAKSKGIRCCNTPGVLDDSVAECAVALMLTSARHTASRIRSMNSRRILPPPSKMPTSYPFISRTSHAPKIS